GPEDCAVLNADDPRVMKFVGSLRSRLVLFSRRQKLLEGVFVEDGEVVYRTRNLERVILSLSEIPLLGPHNLENVLAAVAAAATVGADLKVIPRVVARFKAVEHRLEFVREFNGVKFYNDSKATNVDATAKSISAFEGNVILILGGKEKGGSFRSLRKNIEEKVKAVFLVGAAAERIGSEISGLAKVIHCGELTKAVHAAFQEARRGDTVLLAPACASFDQFENFEHRGRVFKEAVLQLAGGSEPVVPAPPPPVEVQVPPLVHPPAEQVSQPDSVARPEAPSLESTPLSPPSLPEVVEPTVEPGRIQFAQKPPQLKEIPVSREADPSAPSSEPTSTVLDVSALTGRTAAPEGDAESEKAEPEQAEAKRESPGPFSPQFLTGKIGKKKKHKRRKRRR
ncbi:MAG: UDP-N-acetylmuramoyl-L-alanine--D-glutamate ligase, partial [Acidobacteriota bacterium]